MGSGRTADLDDRDRRRAAAPTRSHVRDPARSTRDTTDRAAESAGIDRSQLTQIGVDLLDIRLDDALDDLSDLLGEPALVEADRRGHGGRVAGLDVRRQTRVGSGSGSEVGTTPPLSIPPPRLRGRVGSGSVRVMADGVLPAGTAPDAESESAPEVVRTGGPDGGSGDHAATRLEVGAVVAHELDRRRPPRPGGSLRTNPTGGRVGTGGSWRSCVRERE